MLHWYTDVIKQYAVFDGRASRPEYWWFFLINAVISLILDVVFRGSTGQVLGAIYTLAVLLPSIGVGIRRLHDTNRTGWWLLVSLVPLVGWIWIIVLLALAGDDGPNRYGPPPGTLREPDTIVA